MVRLDRELALNIEYSHKYSGVVGKMFVGGGGWIHRQSGSELRANPYSK